MIRKMSRKRLHDNIDRKKTRKRLPGNDEQKSRKRRRENIDLKKCLKEYLKKQRRKKTGILRQTAEAKDAVVFVTDACLLIYLRIK